MMLNRLLNIIIRLYRKLKIFILKPLWKLNTLILFKAFNVTYKSFSTMGIPYISINKSGKLIIGDEFKMNNNFSGNIIGRQQKCIFVIKSGNLKIGNNVGISSTAFVCYDSIIIGNNVRIGGNTTIYDTDFHSLHVKDRIAIPENKKNIKTSPVQIGNNVFIGGHTTILKGVKIGDNSIIGAGSLVTKNVPANEIWAGNPAKYIRTIVND